MLDFNLITWLEQGWLILVAIVGGITLLWNFINKTLREITASFAKPVKDIEEKLDKLNSKLDDEANHNKKVEKALLTMQRSSILRASSEYLTKGFATLEEKETISEQFTSYSELGGNSFVHTTVADVMDLPLETKQKKTRKRKSKED